MLLQYKLLGCSSPNWQCLCSKSGFTNGLRDCSNQACGPVLASGVISYVQTYCSSAGSSPGPDSPTGVATLPSCGQTCMNNMLAKHLSLGCSSPDTRCLCQNVDYHYGIRDCSIALCGGAVASSVTAFVNSACTIATAAPKA
jgi:hypothetical protein